jgi:hypothetical protein
VDVSTKTQPPDELGPLLDPQPAGAPQLEEDPAPLLVEPLLADPLLVDPLLLESLPPEELPELLPEDEPDPTSLVLPPQAPDAANERRSAEVSPMGARNRFTMGDVALHAPCLVQAGVSACVSGADVCQIGPR